MKIYLTPLKWRFNTYIFTVLLLSLSSTLSVGCQDDLYLIRNEGEITIESSIPYIEYISFVAQGNNYHINFSENIFGVNNLTGKYNHPKKASITVNERTYEAVTRALSSSNYEITIAIPKGFTSPSSITVTDVKLPNGGSLNAKLNQFILAKEGTFLLVATNKEKIAYYKINFVVPSLEGAELKKFTFKYKSITYTPEFVGTKARVILAAGESLDGEVEIEEIEVTQGATSDRAVNQAVSLENNGFTINVVSNNRIRNTYEVLFTSPPIEESERDRSNLKLITSFSAKINGQSYTASISEPKQHIIFSLPKDSSPNEVVIETIETSDKSSTSLKVGDTLPLINNRGQITITAENKTHIDYAIIFSIQGEDPKIETFQLSIDNTTYSADNIDHQRKTITVIVPTIPSSKTLNIASITTIPLNLEYEPKNALNFSSTNTSTITIFIEGKSFDYTIILQVDVAPPGPRIATYSGNNEIGLGAFDESNANVITITNIPNGDVTVNLGEIEFKKTVINKELVISSSDLGQLYNKLSQEKTSRAQLKFIISSGDKDIVNQSYSYNPLSIANIYDLQGLRKSYSTPTTEDHIDLAENMIFTLASDINLNNYKFDPIGGEKNVDPSKNQVRDKYIRFHGTLDGNSHTISGLVIEPSEEKDYLGLIGYLGEKGHVKNLTLRGIKIQATKSSLVGTVAGRNEGTIENCNVIFQEDISSIQGDNLVGGLVGKNEGVIKMSRLIGSNQIKTTIQGNYDVGGICGSNIVNESSSMISYSSVENVNIIATEENAGGIVGKNGGEPSSLKVLPPNAPSVVKTSSTTNVIINSKKNSGGLVGNNTDKGELSDCYAENTSVHGKDDIGGIVGVNNGKIITVYVTGMVEGEDKVGGAIGYQLGASEIKNIYVEVDIKLTHTTSSPSPFNPNYGEIIGLGNGGENLYLKASPKIDGDKSIYTHNEATNSSTFTDIASISNFEGFNEDTWLIKQGEWPTLKPQPENSR